MVLGYLAYALWGLAAPFAWGHYGYHGGFHGSAARNLVRHGDFTPTPWAGQSAPPKEARYLHHPILCPQYLVPVQAVLGDSEWTIRLVPVLFTLGLVFAVAWVGRRFWGPWTGVLAALVFVLLPHNMVFCQLYDHETPGNLYTLLGVAGLLGFLRGFRWPWAVLCLGAFLLAGLTDWPPYFIAFAALWVGTGALVTQTLIPQRPERVLVWLGAVAVLGAATWWLLSRKAGWPAWQVSVALFGLMLGALIGGASRPAATRGPWRPLLSRWGLLVGLSAVVLLTFWFHFKYTAWVGMADDVNNAFKVRSAGSDAWRYVGKYLKNVSHTFTPTLLVTAALWFLVLPVRVALGRPLLRAALPWVFLVGQVMHNLQFPNEVDIHNYRTYYYVIAATFLFVDLAWEGRALVGWVTRRWGASAGWRAPALHGALAAVVGGALVTVAISAWPVLVEGRRRSGTLRYFAPYSSQLDKIAVFAEVRRRTDPRTMVLYTPGVAPRFEALWTLDRDTRKVFFIPGDARAARRAARPRVHRARGVWRHRRVHRGQPPPQVDPPGRPRDVVLLTPARPGRRFGRQVERVRHHYATTRLGSWLLVDYRRPGPVYRAYRVVKTGWRSLWQRYIAGPHRPRRLVRDLWDEWRVASLSGLPLSGRPVLRHPPRPGAYRDDWLAWLNARRVADDAAGAKVALRGLKRHLRVPADPRLSPDLRLVGTITGTTLVALFVEARVNDPRPCRLDFEGVTTGRRRRPRRWTVAVLPQLERWPKGVVYVVSVPHRSRRGAPKELWMSRCEGAFSGVDAPKRIRLAGPERGR